MSSSSISSVCVYCGSANDVPQSFKTLAKDVGGRLAQEKIHIVYGGGHVGLMGIVADAGMAGGSKVIGIIPQHISAKEVQHNGLTELHIVPDMHTRKRMMVERADAFVILPGGLGTLDECFEILTWKKLQLHNKPIIIFNFEGYWNPLLTLIDSTIKDHFSLPSDRALFQVVDTVDALITALHNEAKAMVAPITGRM